ncbi:hypothetical protein [Geothrix sp. PMB-07]|uniref:hypothetical protein n=1 Tax=Geothrix sp. PMB-07 TaxID=3068640 RepID=UPI00274278EB|nr:hypothetical protein [Geothrix sp. PMB-07]WLT30855.1 hypothetical protein Q9293_14130 [Geothrix sp. PMB-07]
MTARPRSQTLVSFALSALLVFALSACGGGSKGGGTANNGSTPGTTPPPAAIPAPTGLQAVAADKQVSLFWAASAGATSYNVWVATQSGGTPALLGKGTATQYLDTGLTNGTARYYRVSVVTSAGESAPSSEVAATPSADANPLPVPEDPTKNQVGLGVWFNTDWDGASAFADVFKQSRPWLNAAWSAPAPVDAQGWPTSDASTVLFTNPASVVDGTYKLVFTGQAKVAGMWCGAVIANQTYNAATNTTTADVTLTKQGADSCGLVFTNTQRTASSAVGTGFTNARFYRPGYPADGSKVFTDPFLNAFRAANARAVRMMDWGGGSSDIVQHWADRVTPNSATQGGLPAPPYTAPDGTVYKGTLGVALEHRIQLSNALMIDCWINIPPVADDDFVLRTAQALRFGTDGTNPYTSPQANPVFPPLHPSLRVYLEYANENWNSAGGFYAFHIQQAICSHLPAGHPLLVNPATDSIWTTMWRYPAWRMAAISETFRGVFGDAAMMTRVRPLLETQQGDAQATLSTALRWLEPYAKTLSKPRAISDLLYGVGGSAYYGVNAGTSADPNTFFAAGNYPAKENVAGWAIDSMWAYNYGVKHVAYEGGPSMDAFSEADNQRLNADPRMQTLVQATHDAWSSVGGDLATYYCLTGPPTWEFTPDITKTDSPKLKALQAIMATPRAPVTLGAALPGSIVATNADIAKVRIRAGYGYPYTIDNLPCEAGFNLGDWVALPGHSSKALTGTLTVKGNVSAAAQLAVWVNGVQQGTVSFPAPSGGTQHLVDSTPLQVNLPAGLTVLRLSAVSGGFTLYSVDIK